MTDRVVYVEECFLCHAPVTENAMCCLGCGGRMCWDCDQGGCCRYCHVDDPNNHGL